MIGLSNNAHPAPTLAVATSPCSYGVWEATIESAQHLPDPQDMLDAMSGAGYAGVDLGPPEYLGGGDARKLRNRLRDRGLSLVGGFAPLPFADPARLSETMGWLDDLLDLLDVVAEGQPLPPKPTLADAGSEVRRRYPAATVEAGHRDRGWDEGMWRRASEGIARVADRCRTRGYEPTFHHHAATNVEAIWEIERVLELTDVGLCFDTGHLAVVGGDPIDALRVWGPRINHFHVKDVRAGAIASVIGEGGHSDDLWNAGSFCPLGQGDLDLPAVVAGLREIGYAGWVVVEQDTIVPTAGAYEIAKRDQVANRRFLSELGL